LLVGAEPDVSDGFLLHGRSLIDRIHPSFNSYA
jgi:hypothetical protein